MENTEQVQPAGKQLITFNEFLEIEKKLQVRVGYVESAEQVPKSSKLLKLTVDFGDEKRTVVTNIGDKFEHNRIQGEVFAFITNLAPTKIMGIESHAMIVLPTQADGTPDLFADPGSYLFR